MKGLDEGNEGGNRVWNPPLIHRHENQGSFIEYTEEEEEKLFEGHFSEGLHVSRFANRVAALDLLRKGVEKVDLVELERERVSEVVCDADQLQLFVEVVEKHLVIH